MRNRLSAATTTALYDVRELLGAATLTATYHLRNLVSTVVNASYDIRGTITKALVATYEILGINRITAALRAVYNIIGIDALSASPYTRLFNELYDYLDGLTVENGELEGFMIYKRKPRNKALFFPCVVLHMENSSRDAMFGGEYSETAGIVAEIIFKRDLAKTIDLGDSRHIILMKEKLARYYKDKLINILRVFSSETIKTIDTGIAGTTYGPFKPQHGLYGAKVVFQFTFKGGDDWEE